jgi:hypothetical protein
MSSDREKILEHEISELKQKVHNLTEELNLNYSQFENCYVDTNSDFRIINYFGATDIIFEEVKKKFQKGENIIKLVNKISKTNIAHIEGQETDSENIPSIDQVLDKFFISQKNDLNLRIMGEREDGEYFMLVWKVKKIESYFRHYFKVIPTNQINKLTQEKTVYDLENARTIFKSIINLIETGIIVLDVSQRITFINESGKNHILPNQNARIKNANFESKNYKDLIFMCDQDEANFLLDSNKTVIDSKKKVSFSRKVDGKDLHYDLYPIFNKSEELNGIAIISSFKEPANKGLGHQIDFRKLLLTIKHFSDQNKILYERISELETNQRWFMKNNQQYESTIKTLYSNIENIPYPLSIIEMPSQKFILINTAFHRAIDKDKKEILGKTDFEIFPDDLSSILNNQNIDCSQNKTTVYFNLNENIFIKQTPFLDFGSNKIMIARIYIIEGSKFNLSGKLS